MLIYLAHEEERLKELRRYGLLDGPPDSACDRITQLAARIFEVPTVLVVIVDQDRQWVMSKHGAQNEDLSRTYALCTQTILEESSLILPDAEKEYLAGQDKGDGLNPRFFAGVPLTTPAGYRLGTLCVIDAVPRIDFSDREVAILQDLAGLICGEIERRFASERSQIELDQRKHADATLRATREELEYRVHQRTADLTQTNIALCAAEAKYRGIFENAVEGIYQTLPDGTLLSANPALARLLGYANPQSLIEAVVTFGSLYVQSRRRADFERAVAEAGFVMGFESEVRRSDGAILWISENSRAIYDANHRLLHYEGTVEDVSARRAAEEGLLQAREELESHVRERTAELALLAGNLRLVLKEREASDAAVRRSEAQFRAMIENAQDLITILGLDGTMLFQSPSVERIYGFRPDDLVGKSVFGQIHPDDVLIVQAAMKRILEGGEAYVRIEARLRHSDGGWRLTESIGSRAPAESPISGLICNSRDITERRKTETLHEERRRQQSALAELSSFALGGSDLPGIFRKAVTLAAETLGVDLMTLTELQPDVARLIVRAEVGFAPEIVGHLGVENWRHARGYPLDSREPLMIPDFKCDPDCTVFPALSNGKIPVSAVSVVIQGTDRPFGTFCALSSVPREFAEQDVTFLQTMADLLSTAILRWKHQEDSRLVEQRYQRIVANTPGMVFQAAIRADGTMEVLFVSDECRAIYQLDPQALYHQPSFFWELVSPDDVESMLDAVRCSFETLEPFAWEGRIEREYDEPIHVSFRSRPDRQPNGDTIWDGVIVDISKLKRAEAEMAAAKEEAERANGAKSEFLSRISHELRTPLNAILGFGQLLELEHMTPTQETGVQMILRGGRQLLELINEVLDIARIDSGSIDLRLSAVSACDTLSAAILLVQPMAAARGICFGPVPGRDEFPKVLADPARLSQVVINLLSNAIKYNRDEGRITFSGGMQANGMVRLTIQDTGIGMTEQEVARLFAPFERLGAAGRGIDGTGLGLTISRSLMLAMDGSLGVQSEPGVGTAFHVDLPVAPASDDATPSGPGSAAVKPVLTGPAVAESPPQVPLCTILHVEPARTQRELVERLLADTPNIRLLESRDGEAGLMRARISRPNLILLALELPDMDGEEFLRRLRAEERNASTPVIGTGTAAALLKYERLLDFGVNICLPRGYEPARFFQDIERALSPDASGR